MTARDFAQTLALCERFGIAHTAIGRHRGERLAAKATGLASRSRRWCAGRGPAPSAPARGVSTSRSATARTTSAWRRRCCGSRARRCSTTSGRRSSTTSTAGWRGCGRARRDPGGRGLERYGAKGKVACVRGPEGGVLPGGLRARPRRARRSSGLDAARPIVVVRTPPEVSLYHRFENDLFARVLERLRDAAAADGVQPVVLPRVRFPAR